MPHAHQEGFFEQRSASPASLAIVIALHAAGIGALMLTKGPVFEKHLRSPTVIYDVPDITPPEVKPEPKREPETREIPEQRSRLETVPPALDLPARGPRVRFEPAPIPTFELTPPGAADAPRAEPEPAPAPEPIRAEARPDPRFAGDLQPPYPASEERAGNEGTVRIRVTIGTDGRVKAAERVGATSDAFWRATERQALSRWRFRPATLDGRPVESVKLMTVHFRLNGR